MTHALLITTWFRSLDHTEGVALSSVVMYFDNEAEKLAAADKIRTEKHECPYSHEVIVL